MSQNDIVHLLTKCWMVNNVFSIQIKGKIKNRRKKQTLTPPPSLNVSIWSGRNKRESYFWGRRTSYFHLFKYHNNKHLNQDWKQSHYSLNQGSKCSPDITYWYWSKEINTLVCFVVRIAWFSSNSQILGTM